MCAPEYKVKYREVRFIYFQLLIDSFKWQIPYLSRIYSSHIVIYYYKCYNLKIQVWWAFLFFFSFYLLHLILLKPTKVDQNHNLWSFFMIKKHLLIFFFSDHHSKTSSSSMAWISRRRRKKTLIRIVFYGMAHFQIKLWRMIYLKLAENILLNVRITLHLN